MNDIIEDCWSIIRQSDTEVLNHKLRPLINLESYIDFFNLHPLILQENNTDAIADIGAIEPSFKNLSDDILISLRHDIHAQRELATASAWAEKLMRFCEIRYHTLKTRSIKKCKTIDAAQLHLLHLAAFLLDFSVVAEDLRFLNIALKLADLKWIVDTKMIRKNLENNNKNISCSLFQFRIVLMTEYAVLQLSKGKAI